MDYILETARQIGASNEHYGEAMQMSFNQLAAELRFVPWDTVPLAEVPNYLDLRALKYIGVGMYHNTYDALLVDDATFFEIFKSSEFATLVFDYMTYPGVMTAIMNDDTDWYSLKRGAMYYGMTLTMSAA